MTDGNLDETASLEGWPMTIPEGLKIELRGFDENPANTAGGILMSLIREVSRFLPLNNLDGVTVAYDYEEGLDSVDRGFETQLPTQPTHDEIGSGVAMALPVNRNGVCKTHIVFGPSIVGLLVSNEETDQKTGLQLAVHELGHAADHELKRQALGEVALMQVDDLIPDVKKQYLWGLSHHVWDEYYASRVSAPWAPEGESFEDELFARAYSAFRERIHEARVAYHWHRMSLDELLAVIKHNFQLTLLATGYLFGRCDGVDREMSDIAPRSAVLLSEDGAGQLWRIHDVLLVLWERRGKWESYDEFMELNNPAEALLNELDFFVHVTDEGKLYIDVPVRL